MMVRSRIFVALLVLGVALAVAAACDDGDDGSGQTPAAGDTPTTDGTLTEETPATGETTAEIKMVPGIAFDRSEITIGADTEVTITADNTDGFHNFAVYASREDALNGEAPLAETEKCAAPCTHNVTVSLAAGEHFFRCNVHPDLMTGTLVAQ
jgi:plastocyanin